MKYSTTCCWLIVFGALAVFLQLTNEYHFFYLEQFQLFQWTGDYFAGKLPQPGGLSLLLGEFLTQFYISPYAGALIVAALLTGVGILTRTVLRQSGVATEWYALYLLPVLALLLIQFNFNYLLMGTVAYLMMLAALVLYGCFRSFGNRLATGLFLVPLLFWWGGAIAGLFVGCITVKEMMNRTRLGYVIIGATMAECLVLAIGSVYAATLVSFRIAFLPDAYYQPQLTPPTVIYFSWAILPVVLVLGYLLRNRSLTSKKAKATLYTVQFATIALLTWWLTPRYLDTKSDQLMKLDYFARTHQWDKIIEASDGKITNYLYLGYLNMALAEKGELGDRLFFFDQRGPMGLLCEWNKTFGVSSLLSDVYFTFGEIALSQRMAFESSLTVVGEGNPRNIQRLVQTNLIYGQYAVAERYIRLLENTFAYKSWASAHRRFLYDDAAVVADPLLGAKRRFLPRESTLAHLNGMANDLAYRIEHFPEDRLPIQFMGAILLLSKEMEAFQQMIETYYGSPALPVLPYSFQEAVILLNDRNPAYWQRFNVSDNVLQRFAGYRDLVMRNRDNQQALSGLLRKSYGNTFWYYYMYK